MGLEYFKISSGFEKYMPKEYLDLVNHGPIGRKVSVTEMGTFKEILEEHPMCAGCAMTLFIRTALIALPNPEHTVNVGTAGCARLAISQAAIPFVYANFGDCNGVASGLTRGLRTRYGDQPKDVITWMGDGGAADIGFSMLMHSWFRKERFTTIMVDNEVYGNTGGQSSGMTPKGIVQKMDPLGKKSEKINMPELAKIAGCAYVAMVTPANPRKVESVIKKAVLVAREIGPTYIQTYTSCNIEYAIPTEKVIDDAKEVERTRYQFKEWLTEDAKQYLQEKWGYKEYAPKAPKPEPVTAGATTPQAGQN